MKRVIKLKKSSIFYILYVVFFILLFNPHCLDDISVLNYLCMTIKIISFFYCGALYVKKREINKIVLYVAVIFFWTIFVSLIFNNNTYMMFIRYSSILLAMMLFDLKKDKIAELISPSFIAAGIIIVANLISMILYPNGIYINYTDWTRVWLIGQKQEFANVFVYAFIVGLYYINKKENLILVIALFIAMLYQMVKTVTLGLIIFIITLVALLIITRMTKLRIKASVLFTISIVANLLIIFVGVEGIQLGGLFNFFSGISIKSDMTKLTTLMSRFNIWKDAIRAFTYSFGIGMGGFNEVMYDKIAIYSAYHPNFHNMMLDYLATGGIVCVAIYIHMMYQVSKKLDKSRSSISHFLACSLFAYNILLISDVYYSPMIMTLYVMAYNVERLDGKADISGVKIEQKL